MVPRLLPKRGDIGFDVVLACGLCCDTLQVVTECELISGAVTAVTQEVQHYKLVTVNRAVPLLCCSKAGLASLCQ